MGKNTKGYIIVYIFMVKNSDIYLRQQSWGGIVSARLFVCLSVCEQLPDHNFSCGVMKLTGIY